MHHKQRIQNKAILLQEKWFRLFDNVHTKQYKKQIKHGVTGKNWREFFLLHRMLFFDKPE